MSIKIQKILRFIPIINFITVFLWLRLCMVKAMKPNQYFKKLGLLFLLVILITVVRIVLDKVFNNEIVTAISTWVGIYLYFLSMAWVSVKAQEEILMEQ